MKRLALILTVVALGSVALGDYFFSNGATSKSLDFLIRGPTGEPNAALTVTNLDLYVTRVGDKRTKLGDLALLDSVVGDWNDLEAIHVGGGHYRVDVPDANLANGIGQTLIYEVNAPTTTNNFDQAWAVVHLVTDANGNYPAKVNNISSGSNAVTSADVTAAVPTTEEIRAEMDANSTKMYTLNEIEDNVQAAMDANGLMQYWTQAKAGYLTAAVATASELAESDANLAIVIATTNGQDANMATALANQTTLIATTNGQDANDTIMLARLTAARAGYLDWLNVGSNIAQADQIPDMNSASKVRLLMNASGVELAGEPNQTTGNAVLTTISTTVADILRWVKILIGMQ